MPGSPIGGLGGGFFFGSSATVAPAPTGDGAGAAAGFAGAPFVSTPERAPPVGVVVGILSVSKGLPVGTSTSRSAGGSAPASSTERNSPSSATTGFIGHLQLARPYWR